jgi:hypothetical protein
VNIEKGNKALVYLVEKYVDKSKQKAELLKTIKSCSSRVPVRGIFEEILSQKGNSFSFSQKDQELVDDLFYYFG